MDFYAILDHVIALLQQRGKASYRALQLQFKLDDASLDVLKDELIKVYQLASDQNGENNANQTRVLQSCGLEITVLSASTRSPTRLRLPRTIRYTPIVGSKPRTYEI